MDIAVLPQHAIRIRSKRATLVVNPVSLKSKVMADAVILLSGEKSVWNNDFIEGMKLVIQGPGDYEVGGIKIAGTFVDNGVIYVAHLDGIDMLIAKTNIVKKAKDIGECHVALLEADSLINEAAITALNVNVVAFYGEKKEENAKALGKEDNTSATKYSVTKEKLPTEMQVVTLG